MKNSVATIAHYEDWKDRRRAFDPAFTRRFDLDFTIILRQLQLCTQLSSRIGPCLQ